MKKQFLILFLLTGFSFADVLMVEDDAIHYSVPEGLLKKPSINDEALAYFDQSKDVKLIVQLFRKNQWADWHMRGLIKSKETFQKFFDTELGGANGEKLDKLNYNEESYELTLWWTQSNGNKLLSQMKLTSFGCVAVHIPYSSGEQGQAEEILKGVASSVEIPEKFKFVPKSMVSDLSSNIGGGFFFIVISLSYLMFSLFKRSQLHQMKLERRMKDVKASQLHRAG